MYRRPYAVYFNAIAALIASLLFVGAIAVGTFKTAQADPVARAPEGLPSPQGE